MKIKKRNVECAANRMDFKIKLLRFNLFWNKIIGHFIVKCIVFSLREAKVKSEMMLDKLSVAYKIVTAFCFRCR